MTTISPTHLTGWGRGPGRCARVAAPGSSADLPDVLAALAGGPSDVPAPVTVRGGGCAYGDAAVPVAHGGHVLELGRRNRLLSLDDARGVAVVQSGMTLGSLQEAVGRRGWAVPVLPGTGAVTVGGAVASDVHGKNQPGAGSFGRHVRWLTLVHPDGGSTRYGAGDEELWATVGGLGLTGVVDVVSLQLVRALSPGMWCTRHRTPDLAATVALLEGLAARQQRDERVHVVAWLDAGGGAGTDGRALVDVSRPLDAGDPFPHPAAPRAGRGRRVPQLPGGGLVGRPVIRAVDATRWHLAPRRQDRVMPVRQALLPMDGAGWWPAAFGRAGLVQYQLLLPGSATEQLAEVLELLRRHRTPPALAVLKRFTGDAPAPLAFAVEGWSLALDFPRRWPGLEPALRELDALVAAHRGRVYLTKDSRLGAAQVQRMYPRLGEWRRVRDRLDPAGRMTSALGVRTGLVDGPVGGPVDRPAGGLVA